MWQPKNGVVFVKKAAPKEVTEGGIVLPNAEAGLTLEGTVVYAGPDSQEYVGKNVLFSRYSGSEVTVSGESLLIMLEADILATWQDNGESDV